MLNIHLHNDVDLTRLLFLWSPAEFLLSNTKIVAFKIVKFFVTFKILF